MVFNSVFFLLTFIFFLAIYFILRSADLRIVKVWTLLYSYFFYAVWNPAFLSLLILSTLVDFTAARLMEGYPKRKKALLIGSLSVNLGVLGFFKYFNFFNASASAMLQWVGIDWPPILIQVALPVGISFYTFQTMSYTIDVYRGKIKAERRLLDIAFFVAFFPQLVAGPIVRAKDFLPQLSGRRIISNGHIAGGIAFVLIGLFLKVVLADNVAPRVNLLFFRWEFNGILENWAAAMLFGVQIYGDFSGYSLIAIGIARMMGFHIHRNFNSPYTAAGFSDFWRRWHISLSTWLRDYLYIPLGGNRKGPGRTYLNLMATMLLGGLWHGASFLFILWGALHGIYLCAERLLKERMEKIRFKNGWSRNLAVAGAIVFTYLMVSMAWIPFRSQTLEQGIGMLSGLFFGDLKVYEEWASDYAVILSVFLLHGMTRKHDVFALIEKHEGLRFAVTCGVLLSLYYLGGERSDFIYFQF